MLYKRSQKVIEERAIERRGSRRATPLLIHEDTGREALLSSLFTLSRPTSLGFWQSDTYKDAIEALLIDGGHLCRQMQFLRKGTPSATTS